MSCTDILTSIGDTLYSEYYIYVDPNGNSGDFNDLQDAFDYVNILTPRSSYPCTIVIRNGDMTVDNSAGGLVVPSYLTITGESDWVIVRSNTATQNMFELSGNNTIENLVIAGPNQAITINNTTGSTNVIKNCSLYNLDGFNNSQAVKNSAANYLFVKDCFIYGHDVGAEVSGGSGIFILMTAIDSCAVGIGAGVIASGCRSTGCTIFMQVDGTGAATVDNLRVLSGGQLINNTGTGSCLVFNSVIGPLSATNAVVVTDGIVLMNNLYMESCINGVNVTDTSVLISRIDFASCTGTAMTLNNANINISNCRVESAATAVDATNGSTFIGINLTLLDISAFALSNDDSSVAVDNMYVGVSTGVGIEGDTNSITRCRGFYYSISGAFNKINQVDSGSVIRIADAVFPSNEITLVNSANVDIKVYDQVNGGERFRTENYSAAGSSIRADRVIYVTTGGIDIDLPTSVGVSHSTQAIMQTYINTTSQPCTITPPAANTLNGVTTAVYLPAYGSLTVVGQAGVWRTLQDQSLSSEITNITGTTTATTQEKRFWADASGGTFDITLPASSTSKYHEFEIVKTDSSVNLVGVVAAGADTINGAARLDIIAQYDSVSVQTDGSGVWIVR